MNPKSVAAAYRRAGWLDGVPPAAMERLVEATTPVRLARGERVWRAGDPADHVVVVRSGCVRLERRGERDRVLLLWVVGRSGPLGLEALFGADRRDADATAHDASVLLVARADVVAELATTHGDLAMRLSGVLSARQRRLERRLARLALSPVRERLLGLFTELAPEFGVRDSRGVILDLRLTHREMGAMVGTARETVSHAMVRLRREGWIATEGRRVVILRPSALGIRTPRRRRRV